jgi:hypothetical protein
MKSIWSIREDENWKNRLLWKLMTANPQQDKAKIKILVAYFCHAIPAEYRKIQLQKIGGQV